IFGYIPFDQSCEQWRNTKIEPQWYAELRTKIKAWQAYWDQEASLLLGTTITEIHKPFQYQDMIATLTLCPIASMSRPLLINVRPFLDGPTQQQPDRCFSCRRWCSTNCSTPTSSAHSPQAYQHSWRNTRAKSPS